MDLNETRSRTISRKYREKQHLAAVACGREKADLVLKNAAYVNVFSGTVETCDIAVSEGIIAGLGSYEGIQEADMTGKIVCPGFLDGHIHLESSLVAPTEFCRAVVPHGTTTVVTDPHEITNVMGTDGIDYMLCATEGMPLDVRFMIPSCVPASPMDESGADLTWRDVDSFYDHPRVLGLAEMMDFPGVIGGSETPLCKIAAAQTRGKLIDGHAPGLAGNALDAYIASGVYSDHECADLQEAMEKLKRGQYIMIREGTAARNLEALVDLIKNEKTAGRCMFCTDDKHPSDLLEKGHIDYICREAVNLGADPIRAIQAATCNAAQYFGLRDRGAIAPGLLADFAVVEDLKDFHVTAVYKQGRLVYDGEKVADFAQPEIPAQLDAHAHDTFHLPTLTPADLADQGDRGIIGMIPGQIVSRDAGRTDHIDLQKDILKMAVIERHHNTGHIGIGYLEGYGLQAGAVATSVAHDSHNIICVGATEEDMAFAANRIAGNHGGIVVVKDGKVLAELPLEIAGLMSSQPLPTVNTLLEQAKDAAHSLGVNEGIDPFMTLSFMSLPVIPTLRLTTQGVFDVMAQKYI